MSMRISNEIKRKYFSTVNMSLKEITDWKKNPCSKMASLSRKPVMMAEKLIRKKNKLWTDLDVKDALKAISFIKRMKKVPAGRPVSGDCRLSKRSISLMNWGFNPNK